MYVCVCVCVFPCNNLFTKGLFTHTTNVLAFFGPISTKSSEIIRFTSEKVLNHIQPRLFYLLWFLYIMLYQAARLKDYLIFYSTKSIFKKTN